MPAPTSPSSAPLLPPPFFLGVDVGGTNIKLGLLDNEGQTLAYDSIATGDHGGAVSMREAAEACRQLARRAGVDFGDIVRAGLGAPGPMCLPSGMLLDPVNLPSWHNFPVRQALSDQLGLPVSFVNDANAAAFGEFWVGSGKQHNSLAMFTLGTGVGGGLIVEGQLIHGSNSFGSEVGHVVVNCRPDARQCVWGGGQGQLEAYASASAVAAEATAQLQAGAESCLREVLASGQPLTAKHIYQAALEDDAFSLKIIDEAAFYLGVGLTNLVHMIDPGLVLLGGAMNFGGRHCRIGQRFLAAVTAEFEKRTFPNVFAGTKIEFASLGGDAGYIGAAGIAHQDYHAQTK
ncbi:MAG: ROK family protein [Planctomycetales bacterium]|nr:ROK family protein [Planctomycetales bacterium]